MDGDQSSRGPIGIDFQAEKAIVGYFALWRFAVSRRVEMPTKFLHKVFYCLFDGWSNGSICANDFVGVVRICAPLV